MRGRPCRMRSSQEGHGVVPWRPNAEGQVSVSQVVLCGRTVVHGCRYVLSFLRRESEKEHVGDGVTKQAADDLVVWPSPVQIGVD